MEILNILGTIVVSSIVGAIIAIAIGILITWNKINRADKLSRENFTKRQDEISRRLRKINNNSGPISREDAETR